MDFKRVVLNLIFQNPPLRGLIPRTPRTGRVQGISYRSGDVVVRGSDLTGASFPALQQRGIKFDPARDLANLKSAIKGVRLEVDREWMENLPVTSEAENLEVTADPVFTHPEIPVIPTVTTESEVTPSNKSDRAQERKDADLIYCGKWTSMNQEQESPAISVLRLAVGVCQYMQIHTYSNPHP